MLGLVVRLCENKCLVYSYYVICVHFLGMYLEVSFILFDDSVLTDRHEMWLKEFGRLPIEEDTDDKDPNKAFRQYQLAFKK